MKLCLVLPDAFPARALEGRDWTRTAPALATLCARGSVVQTPWYGVDEWIIAEHGIDDPCRAAPAALSLAADGHDPGDGWWLRADPVHVMVTRDALVLGDVPMRDIAAAEAAELVATLNAHFRDEGLVFLAAAPDRWYVALPGPVDIGCPPPETVRGRALESFLPQGRDARAWRARLNEIQMALHEHPVNAAREERGALSVNSVWPWGEGCLVRLPEARYGQVWSDRPTIVGLACSTGIGAGEAPVDAAQCLERLGEDDLVVLDSPSLEAVMAEDGRIALAALERDWFAPLLAALRNGRPESLRLLCAAADAPIALDIAVRRRELWQVWRRVPTMSLVT